MAQKSAMVEAICTEIGLQASYLPSRHLETIYLGGGTPSLLQKHELEQIFETIHRYFTVNPNAEITLEANPDDLSLAQLQAFKQAGINRLSIGVQSFYEPHLQQMHRAHQAHQAESCIKLAQDQGFHNISIDLIYAIPHPDHRVLEADLDKVLALSLPHISAYCLTIEPQTVFGKWHKQGKMPAIDDHFAAEQFDILIKTLCSAGYEQYEISNFAHAQQYSKHNTSYWQQKPYLGIGPSAHSYHGNTRQYNVANNAQYIKAIAQGQVPATVEHLSIADQINEYLLTGLRTQWGCSLRYLEQLGQASFVQRQAPIIARLTQIGHLSINADVMKLTETGKFFADRIASDLFVE